MARPKAPIRVEGDRELIAALGRFRGRLDDMPAVHQAAGAPVLAEAIAIVPVDDGDLRGTLRLETDPTGFSVQAGSSVVPYAGVIHFGWAAHGIEPDPYLYAAADRRADEVRDRYADGIGDLVERFDRETPDR